MEIAHFIENFIFFVMKILLFCENITKQAEAEVVPSSS